LFFFAATAATEIFLSPERSITRHASLLLFFCHVHMLSPKRQTWIWDLKKWLINSASLHIIRNRGKERVDRVLYIGEGGKLEREREVTIGRPCLPLVYKTLPTLSTTYSPLCPPARPAPFFYSSFSFALSSLSFLFLWLWFSPFYEGLCSGRVDGSSAMFQCWTGRC